MLLKATIDTVAAMEAVKPKDLERVIVDTTVQEKAIAHPVNSRLLEIARHKVVSAATHGPAWIVRVRDWLDGETTGRKPIFGHAVWVAQNAK